MLIRLFLLLFLTPSLLAVDKSAALAHVTVVSVNSLLFYPSHNAPAWVQSLNHSKIPAQISAVIERIAVRVGDKVKLGQSLVVFDCAQPSLNVAVQQAQQQQLNTQYLFQQRRMEGGNNLAAKKLSVSLN